MWLEIMLLVVVLAVFAVLYAFRKNTYVKKYWKLSLVLIPFVIFLILKIISDIRRPKPTPGTGGQPSGGLEGKVQELKDQMVDIQLESSAEIAVAKAKNEEMVKKLEEVKTIADRSERRRRLIAIIG